MNRKNSSDSNGVIRSRSTTTGSRRTIQTSLSDFFARVDVDPIFEESTETEDPIAEESTDTEDPIAEVSMETEDLESTNDEELNDSTTEASMEIEASNDDMEFNSYDSESTSDSEEATTAASHSKKTRRSNNKPSYAEYDSDSEMSTDEKDSHSAYEESDDSDAASEALEYESDSGMSVDDDDVDNDDDDDYGSNIQDQQLDDDDDDSAAIGSIEVDNDDDDDYDSNIQDQQLDDDDSAATGSIEVDNSWFENDWAASFDSDTETDESSENSDDESTTTADDEGSVDNEPDPPRERLNPDSPVDLPVNVSSIDLTATVIGVACNDKRLRRKIRKAARKMIVALIKHNAFRCPMNKYTRDKLKPLGICSTVHQIYCIFKEGFPHIIEKVGQSGNTRDRYFEDPSVLARTFILVSQNNISLELDTILVGIVDKLLNYICNDKSLPQDIRRLCHTILHRGGDALGMKRQYYIQLIEIGSQHRYGLAVQAEIFATGEKEQQERRLKVQNAFETWIASESDDLSSFIGRPVKMVSTWETGQCKDLHSSQVCANDYVASGLTWVNVMRAIYENTSDPDEIFAREWTDEEIYEGQQRIFQWIVDIINNGGVLILAKNQEQLFPNNLLAKVLQRFYNFEIKFSINGGRILSLSHREAKAKVILYCPLGFSMDSRFSGKLEIKLRTYLEMGVLKRVVCHLLGKPIPTMTPSEDEPDCITAMFFYESILNKFHGSLRIAAAFARDALTPDNIYACKENNLSKVSEDHNGHISTKARSKTWYVPPRRPLEKSVISEGANRLARALEATLKIVVCQIYDLYSAPNSDGKLPSRQAIGVRVNSLLNNYITCPKFRKICKRIIETTLKANRGNRSGYKPTDTGANDDVLKLLWDSRHFLIQMEKPAARTPAAKFHPSICNDPSKRNDPVFKSTCNDPVFKKYDYVDQKHFVFNGLRNRVTKRVKQNNTNHVKACEMEGNRRCRILGKVYIFLDGSGRKPIVKLGKHTRPAGTWRCTVLGICWLADPANDPPKNQSKSKKRKR